jgi:hypothetical protein
MQLGVSYSIGSGLIRYASVAIPADTVVNVMYSSVGRHLFTIVQLDTGVTLKSRGDRYNRPLSTYVFAPKKTLDEISKEISYK